MAESNEGSSNWWNSWINAAKTKGSEVLEFVKKDLEEFGSVVKNEATNVVSSTGNALEKTLKLNEPESTASNMKRSLSSFLGQMNTILNPLPDDSDTETVLINENSEIVTLTKLQKSIYELQKNEKTFISDPDEALRTKYELFLEIVDEFLTEEKLTKHLTSSQILNSQYLNLVPEKVSHQQFWKRYLFRKALIEDEIANQERIEKKVKKEQEIAEENLQWEKDFATDIDLTEEEQIRLLENYEKERILTKKSEKNLDNETTDNEIEIEKNLKSEVDEVIFNTPKKIEKNSKTKKTPKKFNSEPKNLKENYFKSENNSKNDSSLSLDTKSSSSSTDGEWEKVSDPN